jgi:hypothetical protein
VQYAFDNLGRMTSRVDNAGTWSWTYDGQSSRMLSESLVPASLPLLPSVQYSYHSNSLDLASDFAGAYFNGTCVIIHPVVSAPMTSGQVAAHEIGHRMELDPATPNQASHVDASINYCAHDATVQNVAASQCNCVMTYKSSVGEFCVKCLYKLRDRSDN